MSYGSFLGRVARGASRNKSSAPEVGGGATGGARGGLEEGRGFESPRRAVASGAGGLFGGDFKAATRESPSILASCGDGGWQQPRPHSIIARIWSRREASLPAPLCPATTNYTTLCSKRLRSPVGLPFDLFFGFVRGQGREEICVLKSGHILERMLKNSSRRRPNWSRILPSFGALETSKLV
ncbi:hypothetical protein QR680_012668 [Steinernema hermaphroditum]|uniref:Uncharacterized protein n=1 Tax=Steinernema hermaphroditum TaxID=289476 RepID=A0AA39M069_9BILA|nr:hypothetical protein QR680_012668 [Steinernema hermaphroditum]